VVACNALWALDSVLLLVTGWVEPGARFAAQRAVFRCLDSVDPSCGPQGPHSTAFEQAKLAMEDP